MNIHHCLRCEHEWAGRGDSDPVQCPRCKSAYWNREKKSIGGSRHGDPVSYKPKRGDAIRDGNISKNTRLRNSGGAPKKAAAPVTTSDEDPLDMMSDPVPSTPKKARNILDDTRLK